MQQHLVQWKVTLSGYTLNKDDTIIRMEIFVRNRCYCDAYKSNVPLDASSRWKRADVLCLCEKNYPSVFISWAWKGKWRKWNEIVSSFYLQTMFSGCVVSLPLYTFIGSMWCVHDMLIEKKEWLLKRIKTNRIEQLKTSNREKWCSRNNVISPEDRQWWKSNVMHHWALFHLFGCCVFVSSILLVCLLVLPEFQQQQQKLFV